MAQDFNARLANDADGRLSVVGTLRVGTLGAGSTALCRDANNVISDCSSSSLRYKLNLNPFRSGLSLIKRLHPVSFVWKNYNQPDFGLVAEEVNNIEPLLTTRNEKGEVEGVKYDRLGVVLINAMQEQQLQIEVQQKQLKEQNRLIKNQQAEIEALKKHQDEIGALKILVCSRNSTAKICRSKRGR